MLAGLLLTPGAAAAAEPGSPASGREVAASASVGSGLPLTLVSQTPWVTPAQSLFDLQLRPGTSTPATQLGVSVSVYGCLSSVSGFDQSVSTSGPQGAPISSTRAPLALSGLPTVGPGVFDLSMPVVPGGTPGPAAAGGFTIALSSSGGQCGIYPSAVYPVKVQLVSTPAGQVIGSFTTHLVYADTPADTQKLRLAVVLPLETASTPAVSPTPAELRADPSAALQPLSARATSAVTSLVTTVATQHSRVPLTLEASPQTLTALADSGHQSTVNQLTALAVTPSVHQFASSPFTPVNAQGLEASGLGSELALQVSRGSQVLATEGIHPPATSPGTTGPLGTWFASDGLDAATLTQLQADGYAQLVLPAGSVTSAPTNGSTAVPFDVSSSRGAATPAVAANADLTSRFTGAPGNPVLAAHQLVAEVAQMYYEKPNDSSPRGLVAMAPSGWADDPVFADTLLTALTNNPIIEATTTADLFATLPTGSCRSGCRPTATGGSGGLPVAAIRTQRARVDGFASAAPSASSVNSQLGDLVLAAESELLRPGQQSAVLRNAGAAVDAQLAQLVVAGDPVTLTSARGTVQVTVISYAHYPVTASLTLTSDKLLFPNGTAEWTFQWTRADPLIGSGSGHINIVPVTVQARASGTSRVTVVIRSPGGGLTLSTGQVSVRSTATSLVGILLSLGAVLVLAVWWVRTSRKRRAGRRDHPVTNTAPSETG
jgi:hypothetical protein